MLVTALGVLGAGVYLLGDPGRLLAALHAPGDSAQQGGLLLALTTVVAVFAGTLEGVAAPSQRARLTQATLPVLLTAGFFLVGPVLPQGWPVWLPVAGLAIALPLSLLSAMAPDVDFLHRPGARSVHLSLIYITAFVIFSGLSGSSAGPVLVLPAIGVAAAILASLPGHGMDRMSALVIGLVTAQCAAVLAFWTLPVIAAGLLLLTVFYVSAGLLAADAGGRLHANLVAEYTLVGIAALAIVVGVALHAR